MKSQEQEIEELAKELYKHGKIQVDTEQGGIDWKITFKHHAETIIKLGYRKSSSQLVCLDEEKIGKFFWNFCNDNPSRDYNKPENMTILLRAICKQFGTQPSLLTQKGLTLEVLDFINDVLSGINYLESQKQDYGFGKDRLRSKAEAIKSAIDGKEGK